MKKITLLIGVICLCMNALFAQYFHYQYSYYGDDVFTHGFNTKYISQGHCIVGQSNGNPGLITLTSTDINGNPGPLPNFMNVYPTLTSGGGGPLTLTGETKAVEFQNATGYGMTGGCVDVLASGVSIPEIYYITVDQNGVLVSVDNYFIPPPAGMGFANYQVTSVMESAAGGEIYIAGYVTCNPLGIISFVVKIKQAGGPPIWSQTYYLPSTVAPTSTYITTDIVEHTGVGELAIVGYTDALTGSGLAKATFLRIDPATGNPIGNTQIYGTPLSSPSFDNFSAIVMSNNPLSKGYAISGHTNMYGPGDYWALLVDPSGTVIPWSSTFDYSITPGTDKICSDIIERFNTSGLYEYYIGGVVPSGAFGNPDMMVVKADNIGNPVPGGEFTYGTPFLDESGVDLDQMNFTAADGLSVYGLSSSGFPAARLDIYKAYFNGVTRCDVKLSTPNYNPGPGLITKIPPKVIVPFKTITPIKAAWNTTGGFGGCYATAVGGGSNAKVLKNEEEMFHAYIPSNGMTLTDATLKIGIENNASVDKKLHIKLNDMLGRELCSSDYHVTQGRSELAFPVQNLSNSGIYIVSISDESGVLSTMKVFISK